MYAIGVDLGQKRDHTAIVVVERAQRHRYLLGPDRELLVLARAVSLAMLWKKTESVYGDLQKKYQTELTTKLKSRFDRFAILGEWNFADPSKCRFEEQSHGTQGDKIPEAVDAIIKKTVFEPEEFELIGVDDAPRHDHAFAVREGFGKRVAGADLAAGVDVPHHGLRGLIRGQGHELGADAEADRVLVRLGDAVLAGLLADRGLGIDGGVGHDGLLKASVEA